MKQNLLKLFVTGSTSRSREAVHNMRTIYERSLSTQFELLIIDVLENPEQAEEDKILATPTLVRITPSGSSRIIGDLSNAEELLNLLQIRHGSDSLEDTHG